VAEDLASNRMIVREAIRRTSESLQSAGVESARVEAEWLLAHVLGLPRMHLFLEKSRELAAVEIRSLDLLVRRREKREPLQHILGTAEFCGRVFTVNRHVLIPRPETELLAELAETAWRAVGKAGGGRVLDFGTGSGCLAITLALELPEAEIHALDISPDALVVARANASSLGAKDRVAFHFGDGFNALPQGLRFGLIVTNPPYIPSAEIETLQPEVRDFDPAQALDGGADGLDFYRRLADQAPTRLVPGGQLVAEFGEGQGPDLRALFSGKGWTVEAVLPDDTGRDRMLHATRP
jgi:release factor glutamine methyltransferase